MALERFDPSSPQHRDDPYTLYKKYREAEPVHWGLAPDPNTSGSWYFFEYEDVLAALKSDKFIHNRSTGSSSQAGTASVPPASKTDSLVSDGSAGFQPASNCSGPGTAGVPPASSNAPQIPALMRYGSKFLLSMDPPSHTRLRSLVQSAFSPNIVESLKPEIESAAIHLLDQISPSESSIDLLTRFAAPLPLTVIAKLLGVPSEDFALLKAWSGPMAATAESRKPEVLAAAMQVCEDFSAYLTEIVQQRRKNPQNDLISSLIAAEADGGKLSEDELIATCMLILVAGHETTTNLIANGVWCLLSNPDQFELIRQTPQLLSSAIEEILRFESPARIAIRFASEDMELKEASIKCGDRIGLVVASANHDPKEFENPDAFLVERKMGRHLSFGFGIHFCLGAALARAEAEIALRALFGRFPNLRLESQEPRWTESISLRGLQALPLALG